jgi:hypothetical protein
MEEFEKNKNLTYKDAMKLIVNFQILMVKENKNLIRTNIPKDGKFIVVNEISKSRLEIYTDNI